MSLAFARLSPLLAAIGISFTLSHASAAVLVRYGFDGLDANSLKPYAADVANPNLTAGGLTPATALGTNGNWPNNNNGIDTGNGDPAPSYGQKAVSDSIGIDQATAFANGSYWSFTLTPTDGYEADLTTLSLDILTVGTSASRTNLYLSSSVSGFATPIGSVTNSYSSGGSFSTISFDLSGAEFQDLTEPVEFRVYLWWDTGAGTSSGSAVRFDNVTVEGTVSAIPEPAALLLFGAGAATLLLRRRRQSAP